MCCARFADYKDHNEELLARTFECSTQEKSIILTLGVGEEQHLAMQSEKKGCFVVHIIPANLQEPLNAPSSAVCAARECEQDFQAQGVHPEAAGAAPGKAAQPRKAVPPPPKIPPPKIATSTPLPPPQSEPPQSDDDAGERTRAPAGAEPPAPPKQAPAEAGAGSAPLI